ncbi:TRAP-type C4-dicarboxylate transport system, periplasmic component [Alloalcanivorax xenomutans]|uniref:TRAP transporter substrate-binding protein n=1 Tax=Alloalcanivorax xenomutans TaxID=1094342 RepID=UPI0006D5CD12|nr:TRAP transporter substrate-binding protein DctP [Alloalcanivorax xenomutans]MBA4721701.1 TRAP transporter substrate-binding protein DctP [Alcanivorax sp.]CUR45600.1 TRAP-type C4-dicarboxylate transport system, periplasmic component [Alloalcanivorax xenomutans]
MSLKKHLMVAGAAITFSLTSALAGADTRTLHYATPAPPTDRPSNEVLRWWTNEVKERTNGEIEIEVHWLQSLVKYHDSAQALSSGLADISPMNPEYVESRFPLWTLSQTEIGSGDNYIANEAWHRVLEKNPAMAEELKKNNMVHLIAYSSGPRVNASTSRPYLTPDDFDGDKVRMTPRAVQAAKQANWNVTPVQVAFADIYSAMDRGTINGAQTYTYLMPPYKHHEVAKYAVETGIGQSMVVVNMNLDTWNSLTPEQQQVFAELNDEYRTRMARAGLQEAEDAREMMRTNKEFPTEFHILTAEQQKAWQAALEPVERAYAEKLAKRDPRALEIFESFQNELRAVQKEVADNGYPWQSEKVAGN